MPTETVISGYKNRKKYAWAKKNGKLLLISDRNVVKYKWWSSWREGYEIDYNPKRAVRAEIQIEYVKVSYRKNARIDLDQYGYSFILALEKRTERVDINGTLKGKGWANMPLHKTVVFGFYTDRNPTGTDFLQKRSVRLPAADKTGGANISLLNKFV